MIIIIENGQFGNQLFQFNFCLKVAKSNEKIIFVGFDDLSKFVKENKKFFFFKKKNFIIKFIIRLRLFVINTVNKFKITKTIIQRDNRINILKQKGLFNFLTFIDGHFENEKFIKRNLIRYIKKTQIENRAKKFLKLLKKNNKQKVFFIQIRLTDAIFGIDKQYPSVVPLSWFFRYKNILKKKVIKILYLFLFQMILIF